MKKTNYILSITLLMVLAVFTGCSKHDAKPSNTALLTAKTWTVSKIEISFGSASLDVSNDPAYACFKDNSAKFYTDGKYESFSGSLKCYTDETDIAGTWAWKDNEKTISNTVGGVTKDQKVVSLTSTALKVNYGTIPYDTNFDGVTDANVDIILSLDGK